MNNTIKNNATQLTTRTTQLKHNSINNTTTQLTTRKHN